MLLHESDLALVNGYLGAALTELNYGQQMHLRATVHAVAHAIGFEEAETRVVSLNHTRSWSFPQVLDNGHTGSMLASRSLAAGVEGRVICCESEWSFDVRGIRKEGAPDVQWYECPKWATSKAKQTGSQRADTYSWPPVHHNLWDLDPKVFRLHCHLKTSESHQDRTTASSAPVLHLLQEPAACQLLHPGPRNQTVPEALKSNTEKSLCLIFRKSGFQTTARSSENPQRARNPELFQIANSYKMRLNRVITDDESLLKTLTLSEDQWHTMGQDAGWAVIASLATNQGSQPTYYEGFIVEMRRINDGIAPMIGQLPLDKHIWIPDRWEISGLSPFEAVSDLAYVSRDCRLRSAQWSAPYSNSRGQRRHRCVFDHWFQSALEHAQPAKPADQCFRSPTTLHESDVILINHYLATALVQLDHGNQAAPYDAVVHATLDDPILLSQASKLAMWFNKNRHNGLAADAMTRLSLLASRTPESKSAGAIGCFGKMWEIDGLALTTGVTEYTWLDCPRSKPPDGAQARLAAQFDPPKQCTDSKANLSTYFRFKNHLKTSQQSSEAKSDLWQAWRRENRSQIRND